MELKSPILCLKPHCMLKWRIATDRSKDLTYCTALHVFSSAPLLFTISTSTALTNASVAAAILFGLWSLVGVNPWHLTCACHLATFAPKNPGRVVNQKPQAYMISAQLLRECAHLIANPMCSIFNQSLRNGNAPMLFHFSKREITPTSTIIPPLVAKIFERVSFTTRFTVILLKTIWFPANNLVFVRSPQNQLLAASNIDKDSINAVVFLELKKAFDTVDQTLRIVVSAVSCMNGIGHT